MYWETICAGAGRIGPLPNQPSANRPPKKVGPRQIGPQVDNKQETKGAECVAQAIGNLQLIHRSMLIFYLLFAYLF